MFRLLFLTVVVALLGFLGLCLLWYVQTPQPIGVHNQLNYLRQMAVYEVNKYTLDHHKDELSNWLPLAQQGNAPAQTRVAQFYFAAGTGNANNYRIAVTYLLPAANKGLPVAQNALGVALRNGLGIDQDKVEAFKWFSLAARQGMDLAQKNLDSLMPELSQADQDQGNLRIQLWLKNIRKL